MNEILAINLGFGDPKKESLWNYLELENRLEILCKLHAAKSVLNVKEIKEADHNQLKNWSELDYYEIPEGIQPLLFFGLVGNKFCESHVIPQIERFIS